MNRRLFALSAVLLLAVLLVAVSVFSGCTTVKKQPMVNIESPVAPVPPPAPIPTEEKKPVNDLFVHPPYQNLAKTYYASASELADELREKLSFGIAFAGDPMTNVAKYNIGFVDNEARVWHMPDWPHKVRLAGHGDAFVFRARGYNCDGYIHWKCADTGLDLDFPCLAGGVTVIRAQYDPKHTDYGWYYDEVGYFCDYDYTGDETTNVIVKKKTSSGEITLKEFTREEAWSWKVPWDPDEDGHEVAFIMPESFWASARKVPLPVATSAGSGSTLDAGGSTVEKMPDGAEYRYIRSDTQTIRHLEIEAGKTITLSDGRKAMVILVSTDERKPGDSRIVKVKIVEGSS